MRTDMVEKLYQAAARLGYDREETLEVLGVTDLAQFSGHIGDALNRLNKSREATRAGEKMAVLILPEEERRALYPNDELARRGAMLRAFAPWAHGKEPVTDQEIALVVLRAEAMNLDALNPHEIEVFKDKRGQINFMLSYVLEAQWMQEFHGGHTKPRYTPLTEEEKGTYGISLEDQATWCRFVMKRDVPLIKEMTEAGWDPLDARADITIEGRATVKMTDWNAVSQKGDEYFAPNARDRRWKLEKRAYVDAVRRSFGDPSPSAIHDLRRARGEDHITPADWEVASDDAGESRVRLAAANAQSRIQPPDPRPPEEILAANGQLLHGAQEEMEI